MRVLHLLATGLYSGAENVALTIMSAIPELDMVYASPDGPIRQVVLDRGAQYYALEAASLSAVRKAIAELQPDIVHGHDPRMSCLAALGAPKNVAVISHLHNDPDWLRGINYNTLSYHLCGSRFQKIAAVSNSVKEKMIFSGRFRKKWVTLPNCVDLERVNLLAEENAPETDVLFVGRLTQQKDPLKFIQIIASLTRRGMSVSAAMVGDGEMREACKSAIRERHLENVITLAGFRDNPYSWMRRTKVLVMPSAWEGFGLVAVEALGLGIPVVCSGAGGLKDIVDEHSDLLCDSVEDYVTEIQKLLENADLWKAKSAQALKRAASFADLEVYRARLYELYQLSSGSK